MANNTMNDENKKKALDAAIAKLEKDFGKGAVMKLGDPAAQVHVETVPTGSLSLDLALGVGGVPKGRIIEIYGPESSGKTTVALHMIAEVQKRGGIAGFIDGGGDDGGGDYSGGDDTGGDTGFDDGGDADSGTSSEEE